MFQKFSNLLSIFQSKQETESSSLSPVKFSKSPDLDNSPFFIIGSPRSGTTLLRDLLRLHPRLECPEETHFFRWADPFDSFRFKLQYRNEKLFSRHRQLDGIADDVFFDALASVNSKKDLADWYGAEFLKLQNNSSGRWFDKTPQNVYGVLLIRAAYSKSKFIHIYRNPLNVVASLMEGKVMPAQTLRSAISAWLESAMILSQFVTIAGDALLELSYEDLAGNTEPTLRKCLEFLQEDTEVFDYTKINTHAAKNNYELILDQSQIQEVKLSTEPFYSKYGYNK